jgi:hypothetical protein
MRAVHRSPAITEPGPTGPADPTSYVDPHHCQQRTQQLAHVAFPVRRATDSAKSVPVGIVHEYKPAVALDASIVIPTIFAEPVARS